MFNDDSTLILTPELVGTAEAAYDRAFAVTCLDRAAQLVAEEFTAWGKESLFAILRPFLDPGNESRHAEAAAAEGLEANALRQRYRVLLRRVVADTLHRQMARGMGATQREVFRFYAAANQNPRAARRRRVVYPRHLPCVSPPPRHHVGVETVTPPNAKAHRYRFATR